MRLVPKTQLVLVTDVWGNKTRICEKRVGSLALRPVSEIETEIVEGHVIVTIRRINEAATGPISVVMV